MFIRLVAVLFIVLSTSTFPMTAHAIAVGGRLTDLEWTGDPFFTSPPETDGAGTFTINIAQPGGLLPVDSVSPPHMFSGFKYTGVFLDYTIALADVGNTVNLTWTAERPFTAPTGLLWNSSLLDAHISLSGLHPTAQVDIQDMSLITYHANEGLGSSAIASVHPFQLSSNSSAFLGETAFGPVFTHIAGDDILIGVFDLSFVPNADAVGETFEIFLPGSAISGTAPAPVPEPTTLLLMGSGLAVSFGLSQRKKRYTLDK